MAALNRTSSWQIQGWHGEGANEVRQAYGDPVKSYRIQRDAIRQQAKQLRAQGREVKKISEGRPLIYTVKEPNPPQEEGKPAVEGLRWQLGIVEIPAAPADPNAPAATPPADKPKRERKKKGEATPEAQVAGVTGTSTLATLPPLVGAPVVTTPESSGDAAAAQTPVAPVETPATA